MKLNKIALSVALIGAALSSSAYADAYVFGSSNANGGNGLNLTTTAGSYFVAASSSGWWRSDGFHSASNSNYIVGQCCGYANFNNFFTFDLANVQGSIVSASLTLYSYSVNASLNYSLFDVNSPLSAVTASGTNLGIYNDLMSGASYGSFAYSSADANQFRSITLNGVGINALNNALGGEFGIGGSVLAAPVPEPETYAMLLAGLGLMGAISRRRKQA